MKIGKKIKELLKARGITQGKLSERGNRKSFTQSEISDCRNPVSSESFVCVILRAFNSSFSFLPIFIKIIIDQK